MFVDWAVVLLERQSVVSYFPGATRQWPPQDRLGPPRVLSIYPGISVYGTLVMLRHFLVAVSLLQRSFDHHHHHRQATVDQPTFC